MAARDARRTAALFIATVVVIGFVTALLARSFIHAMASFPRLSALGPNAAPVAAPGTAESLAEEDRTPEIRGRILSAEGNAVAGAAVRLVSVPGLGVYRETTSDGAGRFSFPHLPLASVRIVALHDAEGTVTSADVLPRAQQSLELTLVLSPSTVRGQVVDTNDRAVAGASVAIEGAPWFARSAGTDDAGAFRFDAVPREATTLVVVARGYATAHLDVSRRDGQTEIVVRVRMISAPPVLGDVRDVDDVPTHARVIACAGQPSELRTESADDGTFELSASALGCDVIAEKDDYEPSEAVSATPGRRVALRLRAGGGIEGVVVDERGRALPSFAVSIESFSAASNHRAGSRGPRTFEGAAGVFRLEKIQPGRCVLMATAPGKAPARSESVDVRSGATTAGVRIVLGPGGSVSGHVYDDRSAPLSGVDLRFDAISSTFEGSANARTDDTGQYRLDGAPVGPLTLRAQKDGFRVRLVSGMRVEVGGTLIQDVTLHAIDSGAGLELGGIGANLTPTPEGIVVSGVSPGDPAATAGLRAGDRIVRVDGEEADGMSLADVLQRLRGPAGTAVGVSVQRANESETVDVVITRALVVR